MNAKMKSGIEIHQRIDTNKLFCSCYADANKQVQEKEVKIARRLRPTAGELGNADIAALFEAAGEKTYEYTRGEKTSCLVESDEEPPHLLNEAALKAVLRIAKSLDAKIVNEVHVMRKTIIDGSAVSGFQRTALIGINGHLLVDGKNINIRTISLEEESSRIIERADGKRTTYGLDRLGIPLIEIATDPDMDSPEMVKKTAIEIGEILRNSGSVQRGIGTIRQDVNISIEGGARIEIKGCQDIAAMEEITRNEVQRQEKLLEIRKTLQERKIKTEGKIVDVTKVFQNTESKLIANGIAGGAKVLATKIDGFRGIFSTEIMQGFTFGKEVNDRARSTGVKGILHSDENLEKVHISTQERSTLCELLGVYGESAFAMCVDSEATCRRALQSVIDRCNAALVGIPTETRRVDGVITRFMRPLAGAARMYPETDLPPRVIDPHEYSTLEKIETHGEKIKRYMQLGLNEELANRMAGHAKFKLFEQVTSETKCNASTTAVTILETLTALRREGAKVDELPDEKIKEVLAEYGEGTIAKPAIPQVLKLTAQTPLKRVNRIISENSLQRIDGEALKKIVLDNGGNIAEIMKKFKINIEPSELNQVLQEMEKKDKLEKPKNGNGDKEENS